MSHTILNSQNKVQPPIYWAGGERVDVKEAVRAATTANITLSGVQTIDGVVLVAGDRVLVKDQTLGQNNGIYDVSATAWARSADANASAEVTSGIYVWVTEGTSNGDNGYVLTTNDPITLGTTALTWVQFNGAGQVIAGNNITKSGNTLSVVAAPTFTGVTLSGASANTLTYFNGSKAEASASLSGLTLTSGELSVDAATTGAAGKVQLATAAQASDVQAASTTLVPSVSGVQAAIAAQRNALAPRQGLVFDGSSVSATAALASAPGTAAKSFAVDFDVPAANPSDLRVVWHLATARAEGTSNELMLLINTDGALWLFKRGATPSDFRKAVVTSNLVANYGGKRVKVAATFSPSTLIIYINGVSAAFTETTNGTPPAWTVTTDGTLLTIGRAGSNYLFSGFIGQVYIYNRALSVAEVLALYEGGTPAAADYNNASNTSRFIGDNSTFATAGTWGLNVGTTVSGGKLRIPAGGNAGTAEVTLTAGRKYRFTITLDSLTAGSVQYYDGVNAVTFATAPGTYTVEFTAAATYAAWNIYATGGDAVFDNAFAYYLGLLCAPEVNAPGNGLVWHDASGNAADVTLPASGVSWNLPSVVDSPLINGYGRATAQVAANASVATYTVGASDASFIISGNVLVTTSTLHTFSLECAYTDEGSTARVVTFNVQQLGGTLVTAITNGTGVGPYEGVPLHIRAKAATSITIRTNFGGTYTTVVYNAEGVIQKLN